MAIKLTKYTIDRRDLFRLTAVGAGGLMLCDFDALAADATCVALTPNTNLSTNPTQPGAPQVNDPGDESARLYFFIDGVYTNHFLQPATDPNKAPGLKTTGRLSGVSTETDFTALSNTQQNALRILTKARVAIHCEFDQSQSSYIESVVLSNSSHQVLGMRNFTPNDAIMLSGAAKAPYVVFDRLNLVEGQPLFITYVRRRGSTATVYQYRIDGQNAGPSRLDFAHLPPLALNMIRSQFVNDIQGGFSGSTETDVTKGSHSYWWYSTSGNLSSPEGRLAAVPSYPFNGGGGYVANAYYNHRPVPLHSVRARCESIAANGDFRFRIAKMHVDGNEGHYMRYFMVLDPVGRILGGLRRSYTGTVYERWGNTEGNSFIVGNGAVDSAGGLDFKVSAYKITDMPYVQIITEDILDAIGRISFRIR